MGRKRVEREGKRGREYFLFLTQEMGMGTKPRKGDIYSKGDTERKGDIHRKGRGKGTRKLKPKANRQRRLLMQVIKIERKTGPQDTL